MSDRRVQKKRKATNYCVRFGHSLWSAISYQRKWSTSCAAMTCHARCEFFATNCNILSVSFIFKCNPGKQIINLLLFNNFCPAMSYRRAQKKRKATNYCVRLGHSLWSAISCQRRAVKIQDDTGSILHLDAFLSVSGVSPVRKDVSRVSSCKSNYYKFKSIGDGRLHALITGKP